MNWQSSGKSCRENAGPRHCEERSDEAIHGAASGDVDLRGACDRAALRADPLARNDGLIRLPGLKDSTLTQIRIPISRGGIFHRLPRPAQQAKKLSGKNKRNVSGEPVDHQGQGLHCRDL
jgi:hypothetical protein